jgi:hypothetical protein
MGLIKKLVLPVLCVLTIGFNANAFELSTLIPDVRPVGQGQFSRFGFKVYDARLWAPSGRYTSYQPFALSLTYHRTIAGARIVQASIDEMNKLGVAVSAHPQWRDQLSQVLPDVVPGDTLTGVYQPGEGSSFYHQGKLTGRLDDRLSRAFFSIWLDPRTSEPALRQALLGNSP